MTFGTLLLAVVVGSRAWASSSPYSCFRRPLAPQDGAVDPCGLNWTLQYKRGSVRHTFRYRLVARSLDTSQFTVMENILSANAPRVSVARTTNENLFAERPPSRKQWLKVSGGGRARGQRGF
jgi:hypothetical protein